MESRGTEVTSSAVPTGRPWFGAQSAGVSLENADRQRQPYVGLVTRSRPEPDDQFSWYATAILDFDTLRLSPLTNLRGVKTAGCCPAPAPGWPPGRATTTPPCGVNISGQRFAQRLSMLRVQVNLVLRTIQRKADGPLGLAAIDVIDEQGLYLLSHVYSVPLVE